MKTKLLALIILSCLSCVPALAFHDFAGEYVGDDKHEKFNRKMFNMNAGLNKYVMRPVHIVWASVVPKCAMDKLKNVHTNIEYPKRLTSCLVQKDFKSAGSETLSFLANSTVGLGGLFTPAQSVFKIEPANENMEQALAKTGVKQGSYLVIPGLNSTSHRGVAGRILEAPFDAATWFLNPIVGLAKSGLTLNKTYYMQPLAHMVESTFADPYDIAKKFYGIEAYIKTHNLDRNVMLETKAELAENDFTLHSPNSTFGLEHDVELKDYQPQSPVVDAMRTTLFDLPEVNKSMWAEMSVWNRSFSRQIKTAGVNVVPGRDDYKFKYILQKDRTAPAAIIYPSIGEGVNSHHSVVLAKIFYEQGYSVVIQGSHFQWEFAKSMPVGYRPGNPSDDADYLKIVTQKIFTHLGAKHDYNPSDKVVFGTSFGAFQTLFLAEKEHRDNTLGISKYISVCPPVELMYALAQVDKNSQFEKNEDFKEKTAITAAKIIKALENPPTNGQLPFSDEEARLITSFIMHQKLSDLVFTIEGKDPKLYEELHRTTYKDYAQKYIAQDRDLDEIYYETSLHSIAEFLRNNDNYKIYHAANDYLAAPAQLKQLKEYSGDKTVLFNNGSHLGFLYRKEFQDALKADIRREL